MNASDDEFEQYLNELNEIAIVETVVSTPPHQLPRSILQ